MIILTENPHKDMISLVIIGERHQKNTKKSHLDFDFIVCLCRCNLLGWEDPNLKELVWDLPELFHNNSTICKVSSGAVTLVDFLKFSCGSIKLTNWSWGRENHFFRQRKNRHWLLLHLVTSPRIHYLHSLNAWKVFFKDHVLGSAILQLAWARDTLW